ncbi:transgelin-2-like isoform X1 [Haliotis cracherodii]|uniref:transgelin-2-like isoform X1 n=1 Tax=Haliotis cracherodii TaxID=6455 RepID=UPI0039EB3A8D
MSDASRAKKSGIGYQIEQKMETSYDQLEQDGTPEAIRAWIQAVLAGDEEAGSLKSSKQRDLHEWLKSGSILCKLINQLLAGIGQPPVSFKKKAPNTFAAFGNIENFNNGCTAYGMKKESLVQSVDLYEGRKGPFVNVINTLHSLGMKANANGFEVMYCGQIERYLCDN